MGAIKIIKLFALPLLFTVTQVNASTIDYHLDQPNVLLDHSTHAQAAGNDIAITVSELDASVEINPSSLNASEPGFDPSLSNNSPIPAVSPLEVLVIFGFALIFFAVLVIHNRSV